MSSSERTVKPKELTRLSRNLRRNFLNTAKRISENKLPGAEGNGTGMTNKSKYKEAHNRENLLRLWVFVMVEAGRVELPSESTFPRTSTSVVYRLFSATAER